MFHLAAQAIVSESYADPARTFETNIMGMVNLLECIRSRDWIETAITYVIANVTILHAYQNQTVDGLLAMILLVGGVIGAQLGSRAMRLIRSDHLRGLLALIVLGVCFKLVVDLTSIPRNLYTFIL